MRDHREYIARCIRRTEDEQRKLAEKVRHLIAPKLLSVDGVMAVSTAKHCGRHVIVCWVDEEKDVRLPKGTKRVPIVTQGNTVCWR